MSGTRSGALVPELGAQDRRVRVRQNRGDETDMECSTSADAEVVGLVGVVPWPFFRRREDGGSGGGGASESSSTTMTSKEEGSRVGRGWGSAMEQAWERFRRPPMSNEPVVGLVCFDVIIILGNQKTNRILQKLLSCGMRWGMLKPNYP